MLTAAVPVGPDNIRGGYDVPAVSSWVFIEYARVPNNIVFIAIARSLDTWTLSTWWRTISTGNGNGRRDTTRRCTHRRPTLNGGNSWASTMPRPYGPRWARPKTSWSSACRLTAGRSPCPTWPTTKWIRQRREAARPGSIRKKRDFWRITRCANISTNNRRRRAYIDTFGFCPSFRFAKYWETARLTCGTTRWKCRTRWPATSGSDSTTNGRSGTKCDGSRTTGTRAPWYGQWTWTILRARRAAVTWNTRWLALWGISRNRKTGIDTVVYTWLIRYRSSRLPQRRARWRKERQRGRRLVESGEHYYRGNDRQTVADQNKRQRNIVQSQIEQNPSVDRHTNGRDQHER